jgi:hypothetical protein
VLSPPCSSIQSKYSPQELTTAKMPPKRRFFHSLWPPPCQCRTRQPHRLPGTMGAQDVAATNLPSDACPAFAASILTRRTVGEHARAQLQLATTSGTTDHFPPARPCARRQLQPTGQPPALASHADPKLVLARRGRLRSRRRLRTTPGHSRPAQYKLPCLWVRSQPMISSVCSSGTGNTPSPAKAHT